MVGVDSTRDVAGIDETVLRSALDRNPDGIVIVDRRGEIHYVNTALCAMTGYSADDLLGSTIEALVPSRYRDHHGERREHFYSRPRPRPMGQGLQLTARRSDGSEVPVEIGLSPIEPSEYTVATVRDVTERLEAEDRHRTTREALTLSAERERIARDLHDTVLQRLFGLGLELQAVSIAVGDAAPRLDAAVDEIDRVIKEIRTSVFTLGAAARAGSLGQEIGDIVTQASRVLGFAPRLRIEGPIENMIGPSQRVDLTAALRETLANVARHSEATTCTVDLVLSGTRLDLTVVDNGRGMPDDLDRGSIIGNGLRNLITRAERHGGSCTHGPVVGTEPRGTRLVWSIPVI